MRKQFRSPLAGSHFLCVELPASWRALRNLVRQSSGEPVEQQSRLSCRCQRLGAQRSPTGGLAPAVADLSVSIVAVVIGVIGVAAMIMPVIGHRVSDYGSPHAAHDRANRTPNNSPRDSAADRSSNRAAFVAGDRHRADDLVRETIVQTFTAVRRPRDGISLQVRMFTALRRLHYGALGQSIDGAARQPEQPSTGDDAVGSDELLRIFRRLRDEQREALISGGCQRSVIRAGGRDLRLPDRHDQEPGIGGQARDIGDVAGGLAW